MNNSEGRANLKNIHSRSCCCFLSNTFNPTLPRSLPKHGFHLILFVFFTSNVSTRALFQGFSKRCSHPEPDREDCNRLGRRWLPSERWSSPPTMRSDTQKRLIQWSGLPLMWNNKPLVVRGEASVLVFVFQTPEVAPVI